MQRTRGLVLAALLVSMVALGGAYIVAAQDTVDTSAGGTAVNGTALNGTAGNGSCPGGPHGGPHVLKPVWTEVSAPTNETA
jgi:hypothetical protein